MGDINIELKRFDPKILEYRRTHGHAPKILIIGKTGTGKTTLVQDLLFYIRKIHSGVVICPTEQSLIDYRLMFPETFIHERWDSGLVENFVTMQKKIRKTDPAFHQILMLDDIMYDKNAILRDDSTRFIFMNGRNNNISMIITMQYCMDLTPDLRNNIDFVFALRDNIQANREKLWKNFFGVVPTADAFHQIFQRCTSGYNCIVLDNTSRSANLNECLFYYSADAREDSARIERPLMNPKTKQYDHYDIVFDTNDQKEPRMHVRAVNKALIKHLDESPLIANLPFHVGENVKIKFKRTWLTLPPKKRHCFHPSMWNYHDQRFNPFYDDDHHNSAGISAPNSSVNSVGNSSGISSEFSSAHYRNTEKRLRKIMDSVSSTTSNTSSSNTTSSNINNNNEEFVQQHQQNQQDIQQQFRRLKKGQRANINIKMI
jgi:hypothetical protein